MDHSANNLEEFRTVVDQLEKVYNKALKTTSDKDLSQAESELTTMYRALQLSLYSMARAQRNTLDAHRVKINSRG